MMIMVMMRTLRTLFGICVQIRTKVIPYFVSLFTYLTARSTKCITDLVIVISLCSVGCLGRMMMRRIMLMMEKSHGKCCFLYSSYAIPFLPPTCFFSCCSCSCSGSDDDDVDDDCHQIHRHDPCHCQNEQQTKTRWADDDGCS